jgi:hypothetical protein
MGLKVVEPGTLPDVVAADWADLARAEEPAIGAPNAPPPHRFSVGFRLTETAAFRPKR